MIASIIIENFQSHEHTTINFAPDGQLTVIVGPSDSGKTAAFRALRWVAYNEPAGIDFVRVGATKARVTINLVDGRAVIRERSKSINRYTIQEPGQDDLVLEGFGVGVPLEVQQVLEILPVAIGDMEINLNLAEQLDGPFLGKSVPATGKAKVLGKLAGTEEVDFASKHLGTDLYRRRQDEKNAAAEIVQIEEQLKAYEYLEGLGEAIEKVTALLAETKAADTRKTRLEQLRANLQTLNTQIQAVEKRITTLWIVLVAAEPLATKTARSVEKHRQLMDVARRLSQVNNGLQVVATTLKQTEGVEVIGDLAQSTGVLIPGLARMVALRDQLGRVDDGLKNVNGVLWNTAHAETLSQSLFGSEVDASTLSRLRKLQADLQAIKPGLKHAEDVLAATERVKDAAGLVATVTADTDRVNRLRSLTGSLFKAKVHIDQQGAILGRLAVLDKASTLVQDTTSGVASVTALQGYRDAIEDINHGYSETEMLIILSGESLKKLKAEYGTILDEAGLCPTCGASTKEMRLKEVV
ncbi:MAG: AAA family ATPase [Candidatus Desulforudaceae bacterium]